MPHGNDPDPQRAQTTRPTSDRARESLFSALASRFGGFDGLTVADLYAGSGALGFEALSRGAERVILVEKDQVAVRQLERAVDDFAVENSVEVWKGDCTKLSRWPEPVDLLLLDPPYGEALIEPTLRSALENGWIGEETLVIAECDRDEHVDLPAELKLEDDRAWGRNRFLFARMAKL